MAVDREALARALREARQNRGMSQEAAAKHASLSRTVLAQIELGNRLVSAEELSKLAAVYRKPLSHFSAASTDREHDLVAQVFNVEPELPAQLKPSLEYVVNLCRQAVGLEGALGRPTRSGPPQYGVARPRNTADAILQGEQVADQERQRLGLGAGSPISNISDLMASQGVRVAILELPDHVLSIVIRDSSIGTLVVTSRNEVEDEVEGAWSKRVCLLQGYALAMFERQHSVDISTLAHSDLLTEIRANAFVAAFLLPRSGLETAVAGLDKGRPSRRALAVFGLAVEEVAEVVVRSAPGSQTLTCHDVAVIARRFGTSYERTVHRLRSLDLISAPDTDHLLTEEGRRAAAATSALLLKVGGDQLPSHDETMALKSEVALLGIEAYRRQLIAKADLSALATQLKVPALTAAKLLELAQAARL